MKKLLILAASCLIFFSFSRAAQTGFTQKDRERLIRLEATLKVFMEQTNKRFEDVNKGFEDINRRFEELRADMNARFRQIDKRFEDVNKKFDQLYTFLWIITAIFTTLTASVIGFAYWDRRTVIRQAREEAVEKVERVYQVSKLRELLAALRELAEEDEKVAKVLKTFGLL